jgi:hypothetical protein
LEVEIVNHHLVQKFLGRNRAPNAIGTLTAGIKAKGAVERASMEGNECGDTLPVGGHPVAS